MILLTMMLFMMMMTIKLVTSVNIGSICDNDGNDDDCKHDYDYTSEHSVIHRIWPPEYTHRASQEYAMH